jgi:glycosyltransferase involved in cell wall biosynthesis
MAHSTTAQLRVLMITGAYYPEISSGGEQCRKMAEHLRGRAHVQVLTTSVDPALPRHDEVDGIPVTRIRVDVRSEWSRLRALRRMAVDLFRLVRACDIVHLHGFSTKNVLVTVIAKMVRKPIVMSLHTAGYDEPAEIATHGSLAHWSFLSADQYLSVSPGLVDTFLAAGMPRDRIHLVPNGIDIHRFRPATAAERRVLRESLDLAADRPVIVFVGFFSHDKQPRTLFDAWLRLQHAGRIDATLLFVGATESAYFEVDGAIAPAMRSDAISAGIADRLRFAGVTRDVPAHLRAADIFVLPSRREGLPVALLEAMSCGLACVASRLPGSTDTIIEHDVNGLLTPTGDVDALTAAIDRLLHDPGCRDRLGAAARSTIVDHFASSAIADRWLDAYQSVTRLAPR